MRDNCNQIPESLLEELYFGRLESSTASMVEDHLRACPACQRRLGETGSEIEFFRSLLEDLAPATADRRHATRRRCSGTVTLVFDGPQGQTMRIKASLRDESREGLGLTCTRRFQPGHLVKVLRGPVVRLASIRWCQQVNDRFSLGLHLVLA